MSTKTRRTTKTYADKLKEKFDSKVIVLDEYISSNTSIRHKHLVCGHVWKTSPSMKLRHKACPKCSKSTKLTHKQYIEELSVARSDIKAIDKYKGRPKPILHQHSCGYQWKASPANILKGKSCPKCAGLIKRTTAEYYADVTKISKGTIEVIDEFTVVNTLIRHRHSCGHIWKAKPNNILNGRGCPKCRRKRKYSLVGIEWVNRMSEILGFPIRHFLNGGEKKVYLENNKGWPVSLDGYAKGKIAFEFYGDVYHGNVFIYDEGAINSPRGLTVGELFERTVDRELALIDKGYIVVSIWEYEYRNDFDSWLLQQKPKFDRIKRRLKA